MELAVWKPTTNRIFTYCASLLSVRSSFALCTPIDLNRRVMDTEAFPEHSLSFG